MKDLNFENIKKILANQLISLRKNKKLSQESLIKKIGEEKISLRSYKSYESGKEKNLPSLEKLILLANFYNVEVDTLITGHTYTDDSSYTLESNIKRLNRLIFCMVLSVFKKEEIEKEANCNKSDYYFLANDSEIDIYINNVLVFLRNKDYDFYRNMKRISFTPKDLDALIPLCNFKNIDCFPSPQRFEKTVNYYGSTIEEWLKIRNKDKEKY